MQMTSRGGFRNCSRKKKEAVSTAEQAEINIFRHWCTGGDITKSRSDLHSSSGHKFLRLCTLLVKAEFKGK